MHDPIHIAHAGTHPIRLAFLITALALALPATADASLSGSVNASTHVLTVSSNAGDEMHISCSSNHVFVNATQLGGGTCADVQSATVEGGPDANTIDLAGGNTAGLPHLPPAPSAPPVLSPRERG